MIVVDSNILAYLYLSSEFTSAAESLLTDEPDWAAPTLWRSEFRNILAGYIRRKMLTKDQALGIQLEAESLMVGHEQVVDSRAVLDLVATSDCSAYDCEFVAAAQFLNTKLVTMDGKLLKAFPRIAVPLGSAG